ncbi:hypothetical protein Tco_1383502 [Tanacetum coccineum]
MGFGRHPLTQSLLPREKVRVGPIARSESQLVSLVHSPLLLDRRVHCKDETEVKDGTQGKDVTEVEHGTEGKDETENVETEVVEEGDVEDVEVLDNDYFESASDHDDEGSRSPSKHKLTKEKLINRGKPNSKKQVDDNKCPWVVLVSKIKSSGTWPLVEQLKTNPKIPVRAFQEQLKQKHKLVVSQSKVAFDLLRDALSAIFGLSELKGIIPVIAKLFPNGKHRFYVKHIHENMKQKWKDKITFLRVRAKSDVLLNNRCEVFNGKLVDGRDYILLPLWSLLGNILSKRGHIHWPKCNVPTTLLPPEYHPQVDRQPKQRKKSTTEMDVLKIDKNGKLSRKHKTVTCDKCKTKGHNSRSCTCPRSKKRSTSEAASSATQTNKGKEPATNDGPQKKRAPRKKVIVLG